MEKVHALVRASVYGPLFMLYLCSGNDILEYFAPALVLHASQPTGTVITSNSKPSCQSTQF